MMLRMLRSLANQEPETLNLLAHHQLVTADMLELAAHPKLKTLLTPSLLCRLAEEQQAGHELTTDLLLDAMYLLAHPRASRHAGADGTIVRAGELSASLRRQFDRLRRQREAEVAARQGAARQREEQARRRECARLLTLPFPPPPVPGTPNIVPLTSAADLRREGSAQKNCVASYLSKVMRGDAYIYRVLEPERATLEIVRSRQGPWMRGLLKARSNRSVKWTTALVVDAWLRGARSVE
jgi:hypothetical protein